MFWFLESVRFLKCCIVFRRSLLRRGLWYFVARIGCFPINDQDEREVWNDQPRVDNCRSGCLGNNVSYNFIITWLSTCYGNLLIRNRRAALVGPEFIYKHGYVLMGRIGQVMETELLKEDEREQIVLRQNKNPIKQERLEKYLQEQTLRLSIDNKVDDSFICNGFISAIMVKSR